MNVVGLTPIIPIVFAFALPLTSIMVRGNRKAIQAYAHFNLCFQALSAGLCFKHSVGLHFWQMGGSG